MGVMFRLLLVFSLSTVFISATTNNYFVCEHDSREECPSKLCYYSIKENCVYRGCATKDQCANRTENECYKDGNKYTCCCKTSGCTSNYRGLPLCGVKLNSAEREELAIDAKNEDYEDFVYTKSKRLATEITTQAETKIEQNEEAPAVVESVVEQEQEHPVLVETDKLENTGHTTEAAPTTAPEVQVSVPVELKQQEETTKIEASATVNESEPKSLPKSDSEANADTVVEEVTHPKLEENTVSSPQEASIEPMKPTVVPGIPVVEHVHRVPEASVEEPKQLVQELLWVVSETSTRGTTTDALTTTVPTTTTTEPTTTVTASTTTTTTTQTSTTTTTQSVPVTTRLITTQRPSIPRRTTPPTTAAPIPSTIKTVELKKDVSDEDDSSEDLFFPPTQPNRAAASERNPAVERAKFPAQPADRIPETSSVKSSRKQESDGSSFAMVPWWLIVLLGFICAATGCGLVWFFKIRRNPSQNGTSNRRVEEPKNKDMLVDPLLLTKTVDERN